MSSSCLLQSRPRKSKVNFKTFKKRDLRIAFYCFLIKMDPQLLDREKELFKLNAKLNAKKKHQLLASTKVQQSKPVQIHTANNNFNYYQDPTNSPQNESHDDGLELLCKKINIVNQPIKRQNGVVYPFFNRQTAKPSRRTNIDVHIPNGSLVSDGKADGDFDDKSVDFKSEAQSTSFRNESLMTRYSDDSSAVPPANPIENLPLPEPPRVADVIPKAIDKKNVSNDGLLR